MTATHDDELAKLFENEIYRMFHFTMPFVINPSDNDYSERCERYIELWNAVIKEAEARELAARKDERKIVALDNYHGHTFSDATDYKGKFDKFIENNERRLATLKSQQQKGQR